jgi:hypothetical protein
MNEIRTGLSIPAEQLALLQSDRIVYIKLVEVDGKPVYALHTADGTHIGWAEDRALAFAALRQQNMEPVSAH